MAKISLESKTKKKDDIHCSLYCYAAQLTSAVIDISDSRLYFILSWNVFPCRQENSLLHFAIFREKYMHWYQTGIVENIYTVLDGYLQQRIHIILRLNSSLVNKSKKWLSSRKFGEKTLRSRVEC